MDRLTDRCIAALAGGAIGDAMGAPVEGWSADKILRERSQFGVDRFLAPGKAEADGTFAKGDGRITDDTLMVEALIDGYCSAKDHLDAHRWERYVLPNISDRAVWVPERQRSMAIIERLWWPERYPFMRLRCGHNDPRAAGVGNTVNCGVAMYAWPTGAVNLGDPRAAYEEATAWALAHNESFAVEAAGVMAAASAAALAAQATLPQVLSAATAYAQDGTGRCIAAALEACDPSAPVDKAIAAIRAAVAPFDQRRAHVSDDTPLHQDLTTPSDLGRPSRMASIEELPVALAALKWGGNDWRKVLSLSVWYGRDCDSTAGMAMTLWGAMHGLAAMPANLVAESARVAQRDWHAMGSRMAAVARDIHAADAARWAARAAAFR